jgi:hypothetical protein
VHLQLGYYPWFKHQREQYRKIDRDLVRRLPRHHIAEECPDREWDNVDAIEHVLLDLADDCDGLLHSVLFFTQSQPADQVPYVILCNQFIVEPDQEVFSHNEKLFALLEHQAGPELLVHPEQVVLLGELATVILPKVLKEVLAHVLQELFSLSVLSLDDVLGALIQHCTGAVWVFPQFFNEFS